MAQIMFESFDVPALFVASQAVLALYATGRTTGIVLLSGDGITHTVPIAYGCTVPHAVQRLDINGRDITDYLACLLSERNTPATMFTDAQRPTVRHIKETLGYVALDFEAEMHLAATSAAVERAYVFPGGESITLGSERFRCAEAMFDPRLLDVDQPGIHRCLDLSIADCDPALRGDLLRNIVLAGGNTMFPGIVDRLRKELSGLLEQGVAAHRVQFIAPRHRAESAWIGGSILASLGSFPTMCITRKEYDENGPGIVHHKFCNGFQPGFLPPDTNINVTDINRQEFDHENHDNHLDEFDAFEFGDQPVAGFF